MIASTDDDAASAALKKLQSSPSNAELKWTTVDYNGTQISIGNSTFAPIPSATSILPTAGVTQAQSGTLVGGAESAYAVVDDTVVVSDSVDAIKEVIDTAGGDTANLGDSSDYQNTLKALPSERLALGYVNVKSVFGMLGQLGGDSGLGAAPSDQGALGMLQAFSGVGESISAESDGISIQIDGIGILSNVVEVRR